MSPNFKVKVFARKFHTDLESAINDFLDLAHNKRYVIVDIQYADSDTGCSAMVQYIKEIE